MEPRDAFSLFWIRRAAPGELFDKETVSPARSLTSLALFAAVVIAPTPDEPDVAAPSGQSRRDDRPIRDATQ